MTFTSGDLKQHQRGDARQTIRVRLLYFGAAREEAGREEEQLEVGSPATAASVFAEVLEAHPALRRFGRSLLVAVNEEYAGAAAEVRAGDEIAIFPPVSGGAAGAADAGAQEEKNDAPDDEHGAASEDFFELTIDPINVGAVARRVVPARCGATVTLDGYARQFTRGRGETLYLVYEAYAPMALGEMRRLGQEAHKKFEIAHVGIVHRTGRLEIGETSVVISVSAPHRRAAFEACEWAIRELKRTVPIWKKEFFAGGEVWVEGEGAPAV
ncbi:MAG: MoaE-MoaD fusion protein [Pyrinomonadaceae bacterium]|jgi:molybdopterin synthase catalytic subunit|nr:MoaE-MoaD fusion protein [Pyrinomonadaceae bacterium]